MKRAHNPQWIYAKAGLTALDDLIGIGCGSDSCAEHECGVARLQKDLGCDESKDGIARRTISHTPDEKFGPKLGFFSASGYDAIISYTTYGDPLEGKLKMWMKDELKSSGSKLVTAWSEKSFGIVGYGKKDDEDRVRVRVLWEAFQRNDIALWTNVGVFHGGVGLVFAIVSRVPAELKASMLDGDLSHKKLLEAVERTAIEAELRKAGKRWLALSPRWNDDQTEVKFWLNPYNQDQDNYGWYGLAELRQWAMGTGPIPKTEEQRKRR